MCNKRISHKLILSLTAGCMLCFSPVYSGNVVINEVLASNSRSNYDSDFGACSDWVELYNSANSDIDLEGWFLSDDPADPDKWQIPGNTLIPAGGYLLFWADDRNLVPGQTAWVEFTEPEEITVSEYHLNFRINSELEELLLFNAEQVLEDSIVLKDQERDYSYGRDQTGSWCYLGEPTPLGRNSPYNSKEFILSTRPVFSNQGGLYTGKLNIELGGGDPGAVIRYTTDGSEPHAGSMKYTGPLSVLFSKVIKARMYESGRLPGEVVTETFIMDMETDLPVLSVSSDHNNLWGFDFGLYQRNLKNREIFSHLEYFDENGSKAFDINAGLQLFGSQIFLFDQKPFSIFFRKRYGQDTLNYSLFGNKEIEAFHSLVLRNGGNDNNLTMIRDGLGAALVENRIDIDYQSYLPVLVFMNGEYWGIFNLREKINEEYLSTNHGVNPAHVDIIEDSLQVNMGDANDYRELISFVSNNDLALDENYNYVAGKIDVNQFINYMSYKIYGGYRQWQVNNKYWKERTWNSKWRWIAFDLEHCFAGPGGDSYDENTFKKALEPGKGPAEWPTLLFRKLMKNERFRSAFIQRTALFLNTVFDEGRVLSVIDSLQGRIINDMDLHIARWNSPVSVAVWLQNLDQLKEFGTERKRYMFTHMMDYFDIPDTSRLTLQCGEGGKVVVSASEVQDSGPAVYTLCNGLPVSLAALPEPGYCFKGWNGTDPESQLELLLSGDTTIMALFETSEQYLLPDTVQGTLILEDTLQPYISAGHVHIPAGDSLVIREGVEIRMMPGASVFNKGFLLINGSADRPVTIDVNPDIKDGYLRSGSEKWGGIVTVSEDEAIIYHAILKNASRGPAAGNYKGAVSAVNSKLVLSGVKISGVKDPVWCTGSNVRIDSCTLSSNGTGDLIHLKACHDPVVAHNDLRGNFYEDTDAIDMDSVSGALVEHNLVYSFFGSNSDGIDLGEHCSDIVIRHNTLLSCSDKGISVGQGSLVEASHNLIVNCGQGFGIKDFGSFAKINQNTLYGNRIGIACFEKNRGMGGGSAQVENTIIAGSVDHTVFVDTLSTLTVSYSLSDRDSLRGYNNLKGNPLFEGASDLNFFLLDDSPCINQGTPNQQDPDGTRADIGAFLADHPQSIYSLMINEINYNPHDAFNAGDWIELYNAGDKTMHLSGWILKGENEGDEFVFPDHLWLNPGDYLLVAVNKDSVESMHSPISDIAGNLPFGLSSEGEWLSLYDSRYKLVHALRYSPVAPWPDGPNGKGATLELYRGESDNSRPGNWHASQVPGGTPGQMNSVVVPVTGLYINEFMAKNEAAFADASGEYDDWIEVYNSNEFKVDLGGICFLTGDPDQDLSMIPLYDEESTSIGPHGYKLFWADKDPEQGILHTDFNIPASGGLIGLAQVIDKKVTLINQINFGRQQADIASGRFPDGEDWVTILHLTPGNSNRLPASVELPGQGKRFRVYPNPASSYLNIEFQADQPSTGELRNLSGQSLGQFSLDPDGITRIDVSGLLPGIYFLQIRGSSIHAAKIVIHGNAY